MNEITEGPIRNDESQQDGLGAKLFCATATEDGRTLSCKHLVWHDSHYPYCFAQPSNRHHAPIPGYIWSEKLHLIERKPNKACPCLAHVVDLYPGVGPDSSTCGVSDKLEVVA